MTNLQEGAKPPSKLGRTALLLGLPISAGLLISAVVVAGGVWQPWSKLREGQNQLHAVRAMQQRLPLLREQRLRQLEAAEKARAQQADLLQLIAGSGELSTFLAQLSREAGAAGVELDLFEPTPHQGARARPGTAAAPPPAEGEAPSAAKDPLEAQGLSKSSTLLSARGASQPAGLHAPTGAPGIAGGAEQSQPQRARPQSRSPSPAHRAEIDSVAVRQDDGATTTSRSG